MLSWRVGLQLLEVLHICRHLAVKEGLIITQQQWGWLPG